MSEYDDLVDEAMLTGRGEDSGNSTAESSENTDMRESRPNSEAVSLPRPVSTEKIEREAKVSPKPSSRSKGRGGRRNRLPAARSDSAESFVEEHKSGKCTAYSPRGTKCKFCGKVH